MDILNFTRVIDGKTITVDCEYVEKMGAYHYSVRVDGCLTAADWAEGDIWAVARSAIEEVIFSDDGELESEEPVTVSEA